MPRNPTLARAPEFDRQARAVPRDLFPKGRVRFSLATTNRREAEKRRAAMELLWTWRAWDVLAALATDGLDVGNVTAAVKSKGELALVDLRAEAEAHLAGGVPTVREMAEAYLEDYERGRREAHSAKQIRSRLLGPRRGFCRLELDGVAMGDLPFPTLARDAKRVERAIETGWTNPTTREAIRLAVSGLYTWAIREERHAARDAARAPRWIDNPAAEVEAYERRPRHGTASEAQAMALLENAEIHQRAYLRALLHLGLRRDELIHTRLHLDLDPATWLWRIQGRGPDERHGCIQCRSSGWTPKSRRHSWRTLLVPERPAGLRAALTEYLDAYPAEAGEFVFRDPATGAAWAADALARDFAALCQRAGVTYGRKVAGGITLHDLRATCATRLVQAGVRESVIAALLGDTVDTIVKTYVRLIPNDLADGVSRGPHYRAEGGA